MRWFRRKFTWTFKIGPVAMTVPWNPTGAYMIALNMRALDTLADKRR